MSEDLKDLILPLQTKWFDMWKSGKKKIDYREITPYWAKRFCKNYTKDCNTNICGDIIPLNCLECGCFEPKDFRRLILTKGYPNKNDNTRRLIKGKPTILIGKGLRWLGAIPDKEYFLVTSND